MEFPILLLLNKIDKNFDTFSFNCGFEGALALNSMIYILGKFLVSILTKMSQYLCFFKKIIFGECIYYIIVQISGAFFGSILVALSIQEISKIYAQILLKYIILWVVLVVSYVNFY